LFKKEILNNMEATPYSNRKAARFAAALFFFVCLPLSLWDQLYVPRLIWVPQDPVATATNLLANEFMFRGAILTHLVGIVVFATMGLLFARIFRPVDSFLSLLMMVFILMPVPIVFVFEILDYNALMILKSEPRSTFGFEQQQETAYLLIRIFRSATGAGMGKYFFGLAFIPFGIMVYRSGLAPKVIGVLILIGGVGYIIDCAIAILLQRADYIMVRSVLIYTTAAYVLALLWFLIKGVKENKDSLTR
jgi:hypothetical protein